MPTPSEPSLTRRRTPYSRGKRRCRLRQPLATKDVAPCHNSCSLGVRLCIKSPSRSGILAVFPLFLPSFLHNEPNSFFPNLFIPKYFHIFQLGSFGRNTLLYKEPSRWERCDATPQASLQGEPSEAESDETPCAAGQPSECNRFTVHTTLSCSNRTRSSKNRLLYFGRFGRFGSFSFVFLSGCRYRTSCYRGNVWKLFCSMVLSKPTCTSTLN